MRKTNTALAKQVVIAVASTSMIENWAMGKNRCSRTLLLH